MTDAGRQPPTGDWLGGAAAVAVLSFDVDAEAPILAEGDHYAEDLSAMSHQAYGPRVGVPRILDLLGAHGIEATLFVPGVTAERWPNAVERILEAGQQIECPSKVVELGRPELDVMRETNSLCVLTCHPLLSDCPSRMRAIMRFIEFAVDQGDVRFSRADRLGNIVVGDANEQERSPV